MSPKLDAAVCPLCGQPNNCAMAADPEADQCWCEGVEFPQELLEQVPDSALRKNCICRDCIDRFNHDRKGAI